MNQSVAYRKLPKVFLTYDIRLIVNCNTSGPSEILDAIHSELIFDGGLSDEFSLLLFPRPRSADILHSKGNKLLRYIEFEVSLRIARADSSCKELFGVTSSPQPIFKL